MDKDVAGAKIRPMHTPAAIKERLGPALVVVIFEILFIGRNRRRQTVVTSTDLLTLRFRTNSSTVSSGILQKTKSAKKETIFLVEPKTIPHELYLILDYLYLLFVQMLS